MEGLAAASAIELLSYQNFKNVRRRNGVIAGAVYPARFLFSVGTISNKSN